MIYFLFSLIQTINHDDTFKCIQGIIMLSGKCSQSELASLITVNPKPSLFGTQTYYILINLYLDYTKKQYYEQNIRNDS